MEACLYPLLQGLEYVGFRGSEGVSEENLKGSPGSLQNRFQVPEGVSNMLVCVCGPNPKFTHRRRIRSIK